MSTGLKMSVYGLFDPRDGQLRYVGLHAGDLSKRLREHLSLAKSGRQSHVYGWIRQVLTSSQAPEIAELESFDSEEKMKAAEIWHISMWKVLGCRLTNLTVGGEGALGYRHSDKTRAKMSEIKTGKTWSPRRREAMVECGKVTPKEKIDQAIAFYAQGLSADAIGKKLGLSGAGIRKILIRYGIAMRKPWSIGPRRGPKPKSATEKGR